MATITNNLHLLVLGFVFAILLSSMLFTIEQQTVGIVQRFGKFARLAQPGLNIKLPIIDQVIEELSLRVEELKIEVETKTADNVFVTLTVAVQHSVQPTRVYDAYYSLDDPEEQITSYVFDVVRARVPKMKLDDVFDNKDEISEAVGLELASQMTEFGYRILKTLVTDVEPDADVKTAMNSINAALRQRLAAAEQGEAEKILLVKRAEGEADSKALQGKGIADQRKAIVDGLRDSVNEFKDAVPGATAADVMSMVLVTQYFDTLKDIGADGKSNTIFLPHSPGGLNEIAAQIRAGMLQASAVSAST